MDKHRDSTVGGRLMSRLLILVGICLFAGGLLEPAVADLMPADGFAIINGSPDQGFFRLVPAEESHDYLQIALLLLGFILLFEGTILRRRGR
jgi:hypothetical protein